MTTFECEVTGETSGCENCTQKKAVAILFLSTGQEKISLLSWTRFFVFGTKRVPYKFHTERRHGIIKKNDEIRMWWRVLGKCTPSVAQQSTRLNSPVDISEYCTRVNVFLLFTIETHIFQQGSAMKFKIIFTIQECLLWNFVRMYCMRIPEQSPISNCTQHNDDWYL